MRRQTDEPTKWWVDGRGRVKVGARTIGKPARGWQEVCLSNDRGSAQAWRTKGKPWTGWIRMADGRLLTVKMPARAKLLTVRKRLLELIGP